MLNASLQVAQKIESIIPELSKTLNVEVAGFQLNLSELIDEQMRGIVGIARLSSSLVEDIREGRVVVLETSRENVPDAKDMKPHGVVIHKLRAKILNSMADDFSDVSLEFNIETGVTSNYYGSHYAKGFITIEHEKLKEPIRLELVGSGALLEEALILIGKENIAFPHLFSYQGDYDYSQENEEILKRKLAADERKAIRKERGIAY